MAPTLDSEPKPTRRGLLVWSISGIMAHSLPGHGQAWAREWSSIEAEARGQTVHFHAWAGSEAANSYIVWAAGELKTRYGVSLKHIKVADTSEVVARVRSEIDAEQQQGSVDLVWLNGKNFSRNEGGGPSFRTIYPRSAQLLVSGLRWQVDNTRSFWRGSGGSGGTVGMTRLTFFGDRLRIGSSPHSMSDLLGFAQANPGRVSYPAPPDPLGTAFVVQVLFETIQDPRPLQIEAQAPILRRRHSRCGTILMSFIRIYGMKARSFRPMECN